MHKLFLFLIFTFSLQVLAQNDKPLPKDPFERYGPYGASVHKDLKTALAIERNVYKLDLSYQKLDAKQYDKISKLIDLQTLKLSGNEVVDYPKGFEALYNLVFFATYNNKFTAFLPQPEAYRNLNYLELQHTKIDSIPCAIAYLNKLKTFKFGNTDDTLKLPETLKYMKNLQELTIENCIMDSFPKQIFKIPNLNFLYLSNTNTHNITKHFERLQNLELLIIENNPLQTIPFDIYKAKKIRFISLRNNKITKLPDSISQLKELHFLDLSGNPLEKDELEKLKALLPGCEIKF
ncbi:MAG: leucine-rich repeat domain-containing protein [Sphingobacteriaceae bacterium]|nr:leucine-rich repeat domain-containing protein [Sphingobacteriaceae bacterium]